MRPNTYILFLFTLLFIHSLNTFSQAPPAKQWDVRYGGNSDDSLTVIQATPDGGFIAGGFTRSNLNGDVSQASQGADDYWILKLDANGAKQWDKRFGGTKGDFLFALNLSADGGYLLGGFSFSGTSGDHSQDSRGTCDYWVVKTDANGNKLWDARYGGTTFDYLYDMKNTSDGGYILGGYTDSQVGGDVTQVSRGANDYWIVKIDANGNKQWDARYGGGSDDNLSSIMETTDQGFLLGGLTHSKLDDGGDISEGVIGGKDYWIVKTDSNGVKQWDNRVGGSDRDIPHDALQTSDGGYLISGLSASPQGFDVSEPSRGVEDYWLVKLDADGNMRWNKKYGSSNMDISTCIFSTVENGYILGGYSKSGIGNEKSQSNKGLDDFWILKIDDNGNKIWDLDFGGGGGDILFGVCRAADGGYLLGGASRSGKGGDRSQASQGGFDYWLVKLNPEIVNWYFDADGDGFGNNAIDSLSVFPPQGYVAIGGDCNDTVAATNPATVEICNGVDDNCNFIIDDNSVQVSVSPSGTFKSCKNAQVTFTASGDNLVSYQWYKDGSPVEGQTNSTYTTTTGSSFYVSVTSGNGCSGNSNVVSVIRNPLPPSKIVVGNNGNLNLCNGPVDLFMPAAESRIWQWYLNGLTIEGATSNDFDPTEAGKYTVLVTTTPSGCSKISNPVHVLKSCKITQSEISIPHPELFPNPASHFLTIRFTGDFSSAQMVFIQILNELGQVVYETNLSDEDGMITLPLNDSFISGQMYLVRMKFGSEVYEEKFVKEK